jgi:galactokinase
MPTAFAPGRVNLIGDHTDYTGGFVLPMAIQLGTTVRTALGGSRVQLRSTSEPEPADVPIDIADPSRVRPRWARYVAGVVAELRASAGVSGTVTTSLPIGAGLSSSAALEVAVALALGFTGSPLELARLAQRAEHRASGVPCGLMDQLTSAAGIAGHALLIDCESDEIAPVAIPPDCEVVVVDSGTRRDLATSPYADRRAACELAAALIGPLRRASPTDVAPIGDPTLRRRARHVVTENARTLTMAVALRSGDLAAAGGLMRESHASLRDDFEVSSPALDDLVDHLDRQPGVFGARLTGAGFGGCAVALTEPDALHEGWTVVPSAGALRWDDGVPLDGT